MPSTSNSSSKDDTTTLVDLGPVIPVADFKSLEHAEYCASLYTEVGVSSVEVTLRRESAWQSITHCIKAMPNAEVGVGTVINSEQLKRAVDL